MRTGRFWISLAGAFMVVCAGATCAFHTSGTVPIGQVAAAASTDNMLAMEGERLTQ